MNRVRFPIFLTLLLIALLSGCSTPALPSLPDLPIEAPDFSNLPAIPEALRNLPGVLEDLGLPDLSQIANLPTLEDLPSFQSALGTITYNGPTERRVNIGERIPGTDIVLTSITDSSAEFQIAGLRSQRTSGDSLDFDGAWPGVGGSTYTLRLRLYYIGSDHVRAAGVHQLVLSNIQPVADNSQPGGLTLKFPFTVNASVGEIIAGTTYSYAGMDDRGGQINGLPEGDYPYRKVGDSIAWAGHIRPDLVAAYNLRMLYYNADQAQVGGIVTLALPGQ